MSDLQDAIETKARKLHDENCVKDCDQLPGPYWLMWAEIELKIDPSEDTDV